MCCVSAGKCLRTDNGRKKTGQARFFYASTDYSAVATSA